MGSRAGSFNLGSNGSGRPGPPPRGGGAGAHAPPVPGAADDDDGVPFSQAMLAAAPFDPLAAVPLASCNGYEAPRVDDWEGAPQRRGKVRRGKGERARPAPAPPFPDLLIHSLSISAFLSRSSTTPSTATSTCPP